MRIMRSSRAGTFQDKVMRFCLRSISIDTVSPFSYECRIRIACDGFVGFRPPMDVITSPPFKGSVESAGAFTTRTPSFVPKYSPKSELRLTSSRSPQGEPNISKRSMPRIGLDHDADPAAVVAHHERPDARLTRRSRRARCPLRRESGRPRGQCDCDDDPVPLHLK